MADIKEFSKGDRIKVVSLEPELVAKNVHHPSIKIGDQGTIRIVDRSNLLFAELDNGITAEFLPTEIEKI